MAGRLVGTTCRRLGTEPWEKYLLIASVTTAPLGSWFYLGRRQTTTWRFCGQHYHRSFCGSLHCGFSADTTHQTSGSLARNQPFAPLSGPSGELLLAASVALQTLSGKAGQAKASHRSPSCTQPSKPPTQPPAIILCSKHYPHLSQHLHPCLVPFLLLDSRLHTPASHVQQSRSQASHSYSQSSSALQRETAAALVWPFALGLNPPAEPRGPPCKSQIDISCRASGLTCDPASV